MPERTRVLVTREHPGRLGEALHRHGCEVVHRPLVELFATGHAPPMARPPRDGVLVTSAAVCRLAPEAVAWMRGAHIVAVGSATARALTEGGLEVARTAGGSGEAVLGLFAPEERPVFVGAARPAEAMRRAAASGRVHHWAVYDRRRAFGGPVPPVDVVTLTSPAAAMEWASSGGGLQLPCVVIGPTTRDVAVEAGLRVAAVAAEPSLEALARVVVSGRWRGSGPW